MPARILIIEDHPENSELMSYVLEAYGHLPLLAADGATGIALARDQRPDLIVCDIQLPDFDGFEVAARLKDDPEIRQIPLLAVTALAMTGDRERILAAGFNAYIAKPIDAETLVPQIEVFLPESLRSGGLPLSSGAENVDGPVHCGTVLVADDHSVNLNLMRSLLEPLGYAVLLAHGMTEALALARRIPPDLIISDIGMCDGSGFDFIKIVKTDTRLRSVPFIFMTSTHCDEHSRQQGLALGAARFFFRPMESDALLKEVQDCFAEMGRRIS